MNSSPYDNNLFSSDHLALFRAEGLVLLGVAEVGPTDELATQHYRQWLAEGRHGEMAYLERHAEAKYSPQTMFPEVKSLLMVGLNYYQPRKPSSVSEGLVARYAWGRDYHKVLLSKLKRIAEELTRIYPEDSFRAFTDTAPIDERWWAEKAGLSFTGKNRLSISHEYGTWFFWGEILTSRSFTATKAPAQAHRKCPSGCKRCWDVCPTGALGENGIDARRCIAYLTIEYKGSIPVELRPLMGNWIFGCDLCQDVCPFNLKVQPTQDNEFLAWKSGPEIRLEEILAIESDEEFTKRFGGSPVHRAGRIGLIRNACIAAANAKRHDLTTRLESLTQHPNEIVRETASWAVDVLFQNKSN